MYTHTDSPSGTVAVEEVAGGLFDCPSCVCLPPAWDPL